MNGIKEWLNGKKTYIVAAIAVVGAVMGWASGDLTVIQAIQTIGAALGLSFLRAGVKKSGL